MEQGQEAKDREPEEAWAKVVAAAAEVGASAQGRVEIVSARAVGKKFPISPDDPVTRRSARSVELR
ncbi:MAG: hypothetical protein JRI36_08620 [Deltaproteobacteria bacterium]|nr:hypothetical protein [Deltaproteobacteria bacterium]